MHAGNSGCCSTLARAMNDDSLEHGCAYREFEVNVLSD